MTTLAESRLSTTGSTHSRHRGSALRGTTKVGVRGGFESGIQFSLEGLFLVSPNFLFRIERDPENAAPGTVFVWTTSNWRHACHFFCGAASGRRITRFAAWPTQGSSGSGAAGPPDVGRCQGQGSGDQLRAPVAQSRNTAGLTPDRGNSRSSTRTCGMRSNRKPGCSSRIRPTDRSVLDLLRAHYEISRTNGSPAFTESPMCMGSHFRRVAMTDGKRLGVLGHGSLLDSHLVFDTHVPGGAWQMAAGECARRAAASATPRCQHRPLRKAGRAGEVCARTAGSTPPESRLRQLPHEDGFQLGFAFENFNGIGKWRTSDASTPIDATGILPEGSTFDGPAEFRRVLLDHGDEIV